jgi:Ser/Thr protein kinase RdoA (MazF antagonist)
MAGLERQVVHGDFSPFNLVVQPGLPQFVTGIIDSGDVMRTALILDIAVPMANLIGADEGAPRAGAMAIPGGYRGQHPLPEAHACLVRETALARLLLRARRSPLALPSCCATDRRGADRVRSRPSDARKDRSRLHLHSRDTEAEADSTARDLTAAQTARTGGHAKPLAPWPTQLK